MAGHPLRVGTLVRIKEIAGTRLVSKRKPAWGVLTYVNSYQDEEDENRSCSAKLLHEVGGRKVVSLIRRNFDLPTEKSVPDWVWAALAVRALTD